MIAWRGFGVVVLGLLLAMTAVGEESHILLEAPGQLTAERAERIYARIAGDAQQGYAISRDDVAVAFPAWARLNETPYLSATHGNRYVNNYANDVAVAAAYGGGGEMPAGAVLAKDSFTVTDDGEVFPGALFLMEKLQPGISPSTANWRYWMIMPDGSVLGDSEDDTAADVQFCHTCHQQVADDDYLFFVPEAFRR